MVRGISRRMIEIQETGNLYYEKAYFIVKPSYGDVEDEFLEKEARRILQSMDAPGHIKQKAKTFWKKLLFLVICFCIGGILSYFIFC